MSSTLHAIFSTQLIATPNSHVVSGMGYKVKWHNFFLSDLCNFMNLNQPATNNSILKRIDMHIIHCKSLSIIPLILMCHILKTIGLSAVSYSPSQQSTVRIIENTFGRLRCCPIDLQCTPAPQDPRFPETYIVLYICVSPSISFLLRQSLVTHEETVSREITYAFVTIDLPSVWMECSNGGYTCSS